MMDQIELFRLFHEDSVVLLVAVGAGAFVGGITRWALTHLPSAHAGTWAANMIGCAVFGFASTMPGIWPAVAGAGFAGSCSTLSTLAKELGQMAQRNEYAALMHYAFATGALGILAAWLGAVIGGGQVFPAEFAG
ncbi:FluC/FEX family fluoride channel [Corynebacterium aquatimens]|uniref:Fluoride-specific ion channel FluC n=1 Tax=Corynebacterium aquatimens TaxID=1190508 RepID=A0A931DVG3_9CORY|nr:CrcB family protein [Corynebacterium aquatimens]MBG6122259.1 CrcB protein [Corynebacterium aquatimens]WJY65200.1 camphor resistance protein CrcB [Corynebacterium aquatimens]